MALVWHHSNAPRIAAQQTPTVDRGRLRVPNRGPGTYSFGVDHYPHNHGLGTYFSSSPRVTAYAPNGQPMAQLPVHSDRFNDRNIAVWDIRRGVGVGYYVVEYHLAPRSVVRGYGFMAFAKFSPAARW